MLVFHLISDLTSVQNGPQPPMTASINSYSLISTPNARMRENDRPCKADFYSVKSELSKNKGQNKWLQVKVESCSVQLQWNFPPFSKF
jgi:hypothetical protein